MPWKMHTSANIISFRFNLARFRLSSLERKSELVMTQLQANVCIGTTVGRIISFSRPEMWL